MDVTLPARRRAFWAWEQSWSSWFWFWLTSWGWSPSSFLSLLTFQPFPGSPGCSCFKGLCSSPGKVTAFPVDLGNFSSFFKAQPRRPSSTCAWPTLHRKPPSVSVWQAETVIMTTLQWACALCFIDITRLSLHVNLGKEVWWALFHRAGGWGRPGS